MRRLFYALLLAAFAGSSLAQPHVDPNVPRLVTVEALPAGVTAKPVALNRVRSQLRDTEKVGTLLYGVICIQPVPITWREVAPGFSRLKDVFGEELKAAGFMPETDPGNLFADQQATTADLQVGALFKGVDVSACQNLVHITGKVKLDIEWQVYSSFRREVVATIETHEGAQTVGDKSGRSLYQMAFAANVRSLLGNEAFRKLVTAPNAAIPNGVAEGARQPSIRLLGSTNQPTAIADAIGSVVSIFAGQAFGSGVLVSSDGYLLTNHHVVGDLTQVKVRWSDGFETTGEVVRSDTRRDVALIKTEPRGRLALALNRNVPSAGTTVFAIGTPLDPKLQSTVTRGIVSATRIVNGFNFIQSDTPVTHGNSGGPLLDERGQIIGLTDWGIQDQGSALNFFIPIGDALDFLALKTGN